MPTSAPRRDLELDLVRYELRRGGRAVRLERIPMHLLILLAEHLGELVTRERIIDRLWAPGVFIDTEHGINTAVRKLRVALGDSATDAQYLQTVVGKGYRLVGDIRVIRPRDIQVNRESDISKESGTASAEDYQLESANATTFDGPPPTERTNAQVRLRSGMRRLSLLALLVGIVAGVAVLSLASHDALPGNQVEQPFMIAVLPLKNLGGVPADDYLSDGLTEELIAELGRLAPERLSVLARSTMMAYKESPKPASEIGRELGAEYVLEGTVRRQEDRVRVTAQLVRSHDRAQVWADTYVQPLHDVLELQERVAQAVGAAVEVTLTRRTRHLRPQLEPRQQDLYLRGRFHLGKPDGPSRQKALDYFSEIVAVEPDSALGHLGVAESYLLMANANLPPRDAMPHAIGAVNRALQLDSGLAQAHMTRATIDLQYEWNWKNAERSARKALALDPNLAAAHALLATILSSSGRFDEAVAPARRAYILDPISSWTRFSAPWQNLAARRWGAALLEGQRQLELAPQNPDFLGTMSLAYQRLGRTREAADAARATFELDSGDVGNAALAGLVLAEAGETTEARDILAHLEALGQRGYVCAYNVAGVHAGLGEIDRAFQLLEKGLRDRSG